MQAAPLLRNSALFAALLLSIGAAPQLAQAQTRSNSVSPESAGKPAPRTEPLFTPQQTVELQQFVDNLGTGETNPLWNPEIQENVYRQLKADGVFETPPTPWYVHARQIWRVFFAVSMLITAIQMYRTRKKQAKSQTEPARS
jgi:hypothetical protein